MWLSKNLRYLLDSQRQGSERRWVELASYGARMAWSERPGTPAVQRLQQGWKWGCEASMSEYNHNGYPLVNKQLDPENSKLLMETSLPTPMTARVYVNLPEGTLWLFVTICQGIVSMALIEIDGELLVITRWLNLFVGYGDLSMKKKNIISGYGDLTIIF